MRFKREADLIICRLDSVKITRTNEIEAAQSHLLSSRKHETSENKFKLDPISTYVLAWTAAQFQCRCCHWMVCFCFCFITVMCREEKRIHVCTLFTSAVNVNEKLQQSRMQVSHCPAFLCLCDCTISCGTQNRWTMQMWRTKLCSGINILHNQFYLFACYASL